MKLNSLLRLMGDSEYVEIVDENAPINKCNLFSGKVKDAIRIGKIRNSVVTFIVTTNDTLIISVNIEYQKKHRKDDKSSAGTA